MSDTKNNQSKRIPPENETTYVVYGDENEKELKIRTSNRQPLNVLNVMNMEISCESYTIEKDSKTGKIVRVKDGRSLSEMSQEKYDRLIKEYKAKQAKEVQDR